MKINADLCHDYLTTITEQELAFDKNADFIEHKAKVKKKLFELLGLDRIALNACEENFVIESVEEKEDYKQIRFVFESEKNNFVPAYLLIPTTGKKKYPVAITLQGHKDGGMYNSLGIIKTEDDESYQPRGAFALQAVQNGYAALAIELRGMSGELQPRKPERLRPSTCLSAGLYAYLFGRTLLGERCWDVSRAIDLLHNFPELDAEDIIITGNSGGGTMSYYAACVDERIKLSAPSCAFCTFEQSILNVYHCICNYVPNMYNYFDMQDLAVLIAPRKLLIVAGQDDRIFSIKGVKQGYETVKAIYEKAGVSDNCKLVVTPQGHYWCDDIVWPAIQELKK